MTTIDHDQLLAIEGGATCHGVLAQLGDFVLCLGVMER